MGFFHALSGSSASGLFTHSMFQQRGAAFGPSGGCCSPKVGELPKRVRGMNRPKRAYGMKLPRMLIPPPLRSSSYLRRTAPSGCLLPFGLLSAFGQARGYFAPGAGFPSPDNGGTEGGDAHRQRDRKQTLLSRRRNNLFISLTATRSSLTLREQHLRIVYRQYVSAKGRSVRTIRRVLRL